MQNTPYLVPGITKSKKVVLFGFSTGTIAEKLNFYSSNILDSPLVPVLSPQGIEEKNPKFWW